jgi:phage terminase large subunit-like protein
MFRFVEGTVKGQPFQLQPFQAFIVAALFGWKHRKTKLRRFNDSYIQIPKKNGKSTLMGAIIAAMFLLEDEGMAQFLFTAPTRQQASICYKVAKEILKVYRDEYDLGDMINIPKSVRSKDQTIIHNINQSVVMTASKEADNIEGSHPLAGVADEYHIHKDDEIVNNTKSAMSGRAQPLFLRITTPGNNLFSPCFGFAEYCGNVLKGIFQDDRIFIIFFGLDPGDDIYDENLWIKGNPNIGQSPKWDSIRGQATTARNYGGTKESDFKTKHCGLWVSAAEVWIRDELVNRCQVPIDENEYIGHGGLAGLDLAETKDILAFVMRMDDGAVMKRYFITEKKLLDKTDGVDYQRWVDDGHLIVSYEYGGEVMDYNLVEEVIIEAYKKFGIRKIYYDRRFAASLVQRLTDQGIKCAAYGQGFTYMNPALAKLEEDIMKEKIRFSDPVTRWMFTNVRILKNDTGLRRVIRDSRTNKIDGVIALLMCTAADLLEPKPKKPRVIILNTNKSA